MFVHLSTFSFPSLHFPLFLLILFLLLPQFDLVTESKKLTRPPPQKKDEAKVMQERKEKKWQKDHAYDELFQEDDDEEANNQDRGEDYLDDFM